MFDSLDAIRKGSQKQQDAFRVITQLHVMEDLASYSPVLCGTIPLGIDNDNSDLDIVLEVYEFNVFKARLKALYHQKREFRVKETIIRNQKVVKANFYYQGFEFELFGQAQPVTQQNAYLHMMIEQAILLKNPSIKEKIVRLKQEGMKTEPAFCMALGITGQDPYEDLIAYGKQLKTIGG